MKSGCAGLITTGLVAECPSSHRRWEKWEIDKQRNVPDYLMQDPTGLITGAGLLSCGSIVISTHLRWQQY
jgi:hypothetical protein